MNLSLPVPTEVALALLEDASDPCAVLDPITAEVEWCNTAWRSFTTAVELLGNDGSGMFYQEYQQQLATIARAAGEVPTKQSIGWNAHGEAIFEVNVGVYPYEADGRKSVAVIILGPRAVIEMTSGDAAARPRDPLTGLPGRVAVEDRMERLFQLPTTHRQFAVLFLDLDGFKQINDRWGHLAGDRALTDVAKRLAGAVRGSDLIVRYGGDEFVVLVNGVKNAADLDPLIARLRTAAEQPVAFDGQQLRVSASVGAALAAEGWQGVEEIIAAADRRMYADKKNGSSDTGLAEDSAG